MCFLTHCKRCFCISMGMRFITHRNRVLSLSNTPIAHSGSTTITSFSTSTKSSSTNISFCAINRNTSNIIHAPSHRISTICFITTNKSNCTFTFRNCTFTKSKSAFSFCFRFITNGYCIFCSSCCLLTNRNCISTGSPIIIVITTGRSTGRINRYIM